MTTEFKEKLVRGFKGFGIKVFEFDSYTLPNGTEINNVVILPYYGKAIEIGTSWVNMYNLSDGKINVGYPAMECDETMLMGLACDVL